MIKVLIIDLETPALAAASSMLKAFRGGGGVRTAPWGCARLSMGLTIPARFGNVNANVITWQYHRAMITGKEQPPHRWGDAVRDLLEATEISEASFARRIPIAAPALFRYLRGQRRTPAPVVRKTNAALAALIAEPFVTDYLNAVAAQDGSVSPDPHFDKHFSYGVRLVRNHMRDGFEEAMNQYVSGLSVETRKAFVNDLVVNFRETLIRQIAAKPRKETPLQAFLRTTEKNGFPSLDWLKSDSELVQDQAEHDFLFTVQQTLAETPLKISDRLSCESRIMAAFHRHEARLVDELRPILVEMLKGESIK